MAGVQGSESPAVRLLTLNAHQGFAALRRRKLLAHIREALRASNADLVFLQEIGGEHGEEIPQQHYELLADQVWPQHAYGRNVVATSGHQGNALLSKFPIVRWQNIDVSVDGVEPRGMLHCVLDVQRAGPPLHAVCVHLGLREAQRRMGIGAKMMIEAPRAHALLHDQQLRKAVRLLQL